MRTEFQGLCLSAVKGSETIEHFDQLHSQVRALFQKAKENLCTICAEKIAQDWARAHRPSIQVWIEVIRQMETGRISDVNPFDRSYTNAEADPYFRTTSDYRGRAEYERQLAYQRFSGRGQDIDFGYDSSLIIYGPDPFARIQQEDRYRDERAPAGARYVQDIERDRSWSVGASFEQAPRPQHEKVL